MTRTLLSRVFGDAALTFDPKWALFSANSFIAAMLAIYLAFRLGLQRPSWAMLTVYLTAQPLAGAVRSRAVYRLLGTLLGACAALTLVPILVDQPTLMSVAITGWATFCLYVSLQDRTPRSYAFMLAGYTATTVAFSSVTAPELVFDTALARVEEIVLGICCATIVHTLLFPRDVTGALMKSIDAAVRDASAWMADALLNHAPTKADSARWRLAADVTHFEMLSTHLRYDTAATKPEISAIRALQDKLALVLPMLTAVEDRLAALGNRCTPELNQLLSQLGEWARDPVEPRLSADELLRRCAEFEAALPAAQDEWDRLLASSTIAKSAALIEALAAAHELSAIIHGSKATSELTAAPRPKIRRARRNLHRDQGLAALSVVALFAAVLGCCTVWIATSWPEGATAAQIAAIAAALFSSLDDPAPTLVSYTIWTVASLPIAAIYLFLIFPAIDGFPMLAASLAPSFLVLGYQQANPRHALKALALVLGLIGALDLQNRFSADFASFINANAAAVVGLAAAFLAVRTFRSVTAKRAARRLLRHGWVDLAILAGARRPMNRERWLGVMLDRLGLVVPRLALSGTDVEAEAGRSLAALQMGLDLLDLKSSVVGFDDRLSKNLESLTPKLSHAFRWFATGNSELHPTEARALLAAIDVALREHGAWEPAIRRTRLTALVGLRRALFPNAQAPSFDRVTQ
ncbi:FUSC family protein [Bradyrhizobium sp. 31Argb]|uniref:FUSC family protein n=1 Tax=Bradyrhizobium sp. 31Argb TaxID=3141247 RepID=UPI0037494F30